MVAGPEPCVKEIKLPPLEPPRRSADSGQSATPPSASVGYKSEHACVHSGPCDCPPVPAAAPCYCTGACRTLGYCPNQQRTYWPQPCGHVFPWYGVVPPNWCPICGAYLGPIYVNHWVPPQPTVIYSTGTGGTTAAPKPQGETIS